MPELPEVETVARSLGRRLAGRSVIDIAERTPGVLSISCQTGLPELPARFRGAARHGKFLFLQWGGGQTLVVHFRMTGSFYFRRPEDNPQSHTHAEFRLDSGETLSYRDPRRFGRLMWLGAKEMKSNNPARELGPDVLGLSRKGFVEAIQPHARMMKALLLDQGILAGLGNIYVDEMLHRAGVHPRTLSNRLSKNRLGLLWEGMREVLEEAIERGGSSIRDFTDVSGEPGNYQDAHRVYGRAGKPCLICGTAIKRIVIGQRGTCYCPKCQRR
jgi:formamidopyrimidine-DNA glycosylase